MSFIRKRHLIIFFLTWFLVNLLQARYTELFDDEAYYWMYSKFPDWGYYDHPPMIAMLIKAGYFLVHNEFGVRLLIVCMSTLTLALIYNLLPKKNDELFYAISCSFAVLQIGGILAVPDIPLAFFVALFFWVYRRFIRNMSWADTVLLGTVMALMLYSKYHGLLVILFTFASNPKLATKCKPYIAVLIGALLFSPHLYWQYTHEFPSVQYHLFERNADAYDPSYTFEYIIGQVLIAGPLMGWLLLWAAFRYKPEDTFERGLKFSLVGFYLFFLVSTLKGRVEANWTVPVFIPLIILSHRFLSTRSKWQVFLVRSVPITLLLVLTARVYMMVDIQPVEDLSKDEFHKNRQWAQNIYKQTGGLPVVFVNSYQKASKYWFYSGVISFSLNTPAYRRNNFNFWPIEDSLYGKKVAALSPNNYRYYKDSITTSLGITGLHVADSFFSFSKLQIEPGNDLEAHNGHVWYCSIRVRAEENLLKLLQSENIRYIPLELSILNADTILTRVPTNIYLSAIRQTDQVFITGFRVNLPKGEYPARFSVPSALKVDPSMNSQTIQLIVK